MKKKKKKQELIIEDISISAPDRIEDEAEPESDILPSAEEDAGHDYGSAAEADHEPEPETESVIKPENESVTESETDEKPETESVTESETDEKPETEAVTEPETDERPEIESVPEPETDEKPEIEVSEASHTDKEDREPAEDMGDIVIDMKHIIKRYFIGQPNELEVLHGIDMQVKRGEFLAIVGQSGSGKSTLMNVIGALDRPTEGEYMLDGVDMFNAKDKDLSEIRCKKIGFVFQTYNLVARTSALKNVELPMLYAGVSARQRSRRAKELLEMVEMSERMRHQPDELSGGQKQRVAIARAMANDPAIILADEPTGALDSATGRLIMDIFHRLHDEQGKTIILITHSPELAGECGRILTLKDGMIINERKGSGRSAVL